MTPSLEQFESRLTPAAPLANPAVVLVGIGVNAADYVPMTLVMVGQQYDQMGLNQYGVGTGAIAAVLNLPDTGPISDAQLQAILAQKDAAGVLPVGPNAIDMVFTPGWNVTDPFASAWSAYNNRMTYQGQSIPYALITRQPWESVAASHEYVEGTTGKQIADPVQWQATPINGINVSNFILPSGQPAFQSQQYVGDPWNLAPVLPPAPAAVTASSPSLNGLFSLAVERLQEDVLTLLARVNSGFTPQAAAAAQVVAADPLHGTAQGQMVDMQVDAVFAAWVSGQR